MKLGLGHTALLLSLTGLVSADSLQIVDLGYPSYQGVYNSTTNITTFLGLRYAYPPTGMIPYPDEFH